MSSLTPALRAGDTVTIPGFARTGLSEYAVVVEVMTDGAIELDNGQVLLANALVPVATSEVWLPVAGFADRYRVSSYGKVVSLRYKRTTRVRLMRMSGASRYPSVTLCNEATIIQVGLNRLVAQHFLAPPADARQTFVLPRDGNHLNLRVDNLQWVYPYKAADEAMAAYLYHVGERHHNSRLSTAEVAQVRHLAAQGTTQKTIAQRFNVSRPAISLIVNRHTRRYA
ncbi:NUMOD4 domain-containing protein [Hymenobacter antarcticus]|uniref:NUMOD4 domain-containing protein n=1 Tax=Hymenobacter antarcticus TaxID=486270 RepID=A0ABP7R0Z2_9BACT